MTKQWIYWAETKPPVSGWYHCVWESRYDGIGNDTVFLKYWSSEDDSFLCGGPEYIGDNMQYCNSSTSCHVLYNINMVQLHNVNNRYSKMMAQLEWDQYEDDMTLSHHSTPKNLKTIISNYNLTIQS
jgi:hypothetical protein